MEMRLEDLQTEQTHPVDSGGVTLGRDSRRSSIVVADPGVSGAHARIFQRAGRYFIEDSNSSNGTFVEGTRLRGELELKDGFVIALHKYKFRVVLDGGSVGDSTALFEPKGAKDKPRPAMGAAPTRTQARPDAKVEPEDAAIEEEHIDEPENGPQRRPTANPSRSSGQQQILRDPGVDDAVSDDNDASVVSDVRDRKQDSRSAIVFPPIDPSNLQAGFAKSLAYYMAAVPKMALMPAAAVASNVNEQPFRDMEKLELALWAAPPLALGSIVALIAAIVVGLVTGTFGVGTIISPIISGAIIVVAGSAIAGWLWHPIVTWWVQLLQGESDARARTNMMVGTFTGLSLIYIATGIGALFTLLVRVPVVGPFVQIGPLALICLASLLSLYIAFSWYQYFQVSHWVPKIIVALGVLTILNAAWGSIGYIRAGIASASATVASGPTTEGSGLTAEQKKQLAAAQAAAQAAAVQQSASAGQAQTTAAQAQAAAAQAQVAAQAHPASNQAAVAAASQAAANRPAEPAAAREAAATPAAPAKAVPTRVEATDEDDRAAAPPSKAATRADNREPARDEARPASSSRPTYAEFNQHMAAIEKMIDEDPSLLSRVPGAMALYKKIHSGDAKLKAKAKDAVSERIRQAELYGANVDAVEELYAKISAP